MATTKYIPVGKTSLVKKSEADLQVQTEYAYRPYPRITTSISVKGQIVHKIERKFDKTIDSFEEQKKMEFYIGRQHSEVLEILKETTFVSSLKIPKDDAPEDKRLNIYDKLNEIYGVQRVFQLDNDGNFVTENLTKEFRNSFTPIFRNLREFIDIFVQLPGHTGRRESGVYEVEPDRLYLASTGAEMYFLIVQRIDNTTNYEKEIKAVLEKLC